MNELTKHFEYQYEYDKIGPFFLKYFSQTIIWDYINSDYNQVALVKPRVVRIPGQRRGYQSVLSE